MSNLPNKKLVLDFYKKVVGQRNSDLIDNYVSDNYIQHSPSVKDGKAGLRDAVEYLKQLPKPEDVKSPIVLAVAEGDYVMLLLDLNFMGKHLCVADLFKVIDGKVVEHWDAIQDVTPDKMIIPKFNIDDTGVTEADKKSVIRFIDSRSEKVHRMITEGNVVGVQSEGKRSGKNFVFYDFIKIVDSKIVQSFRVEQEVQHMMYHNNGMI